MSSNPVVREAQDADSYNPLAKQKAAAKLSRIPVKVEAAPVLKKPEWIRVKAGSPTTRFYEIKDILRSNKLVTVCDCLLYTSPSPRDYAASRMPSSA